MSRAAEEAYEKRFALVMEKAKKEMVPGATVYRAGWYSIEEGKVTRVDRCFLGPQGDPQIDPNGDKLLFHAEFTTGTRWESQTYPWRFFTKPEVARARAVQRLKNAVEELEDRIEVHKNLIAEYEKLGTGYLPEDAG